VNTFWLVEATEKAIQKREVCISLSDWIQTYVVCCFMLNESFAEENLICHDPGVFIYVSAVLLQLFNIWTAGEVLLMCTIVSLLVTL
jgi:hypothetical protein